MHKSTFLIVMAIWLGIMSMMGSTAFGQGQFRTVADTGIVHLGPNQILRISGDGVDQDDVVVRFRRISYSQTGCNAGICKQIISSQTLSAPIAIAPNEGATLDVMGNQIGTDGVRVVVVSGNPKMRVNASIIDTVTGQTTSILIALLLP